MTPAYVAALFDDYAPRFEAHLTQALAYRGPQILSERWIRLLPAGVLQRRWTSAAAQG